MIRTLRLLFRLWSPQSKNFKEVEIEDGSYIVGFKLCDLELQNYKLSWAVCVLIKFFKENTIPHSYLLNVARIHKTFSECFSC